VRIASKKQIPLLQVPAVAPQSKPYANFDQINGTHPWQQAAPEGFVLYQTRILRKSKVVFFNFALAKEMGLIAKDHVEHLTKNLERKLIETFALRVINEYDLVNKIKYPAKDIKQNPYMATRYLQLQHASVRGTTSGDGRSIWNGSFAAKGIRWDVSSCGTGATCLSPGAVLSKKPIKTGNKSVCYGNGLADLDEGLTAAIQSEVFNKKGISTERTLLIVQTPEQSAINVRAATNLLRPSHVFVPLKQSKHEALKNAYDYFLDRKIKNGEFPPLPFGALRYDAALRILARSYARFVAKLEHEYIFCWLAWDGDNMLMDGGIIDYGSIRQFGLCHHRYRYDDVDRFSTNLFEQRHEAKRLIQTLAQLTEFVKTGKKLSLGRFTKHNAIKLFKQEFEMELDYALLTSLGFSESNRESILRKNTKVWKRLKGALRNLERAIVEGGLRTVADGVNQSALYDVRKLWPELSKSALKNQPLSAKTCFDLIATENTKKRYSSPSRGFERNINQLQQAYAELISFLSDNPKRLLLENTMRASLQGVAPALTGDATIYIVDALVKAKRNLTSRDFQYVLSQLIADFSGNRENFKLSQKAAKLRLRAHQIATKFRHSI
jgi:uncharacterized protein YdiU (UPF0061 family)